MTDEKGGSRHGIDNAGEIALGVPKAPGSEKRPADVVGCAVHVARIATGEI